MKVDLKCIRCLRDNGLEYSNEESLTQYKEKIKLSKISSECKKYVNSVKDVDDKNILLNHSFLMADITMADYFKEYIEKNSIYKLNDTGNSFLKKLTAEKILLGPAYVQIIKNRYIYKQLNGREMQQVAYRNWGSVISGLAIKLYTGPPPPLLWFILAYLAKIYKPGMTIDNFKDTYVDSDNIKNMRQAMTHLDEKYQVLDTKYNYINFLDVIDYNQFNLLFNSSFYEIVNKSINPLLYKFLTTLNKNKGKNIAIGLGLLYSAVVLGKNIKKITPKSKKKGPKKKKIESK